MNPLARARAGRRHSGVALLTVLLIAALVTIVAVAMIARQRTAIARTAQLNSLAQARAYALGAETFARALLTQDIREHPQPPRTDTLADAWAKPVAPFEVACGALQLRVLDAGSGFNVNSLALGGTNPATQRLRTLLAALDIDPQFADQIKDWVDADEDVGGGGGEDGLYLAREPAYRTANALMADTSELDLIGELTPEQRARLAGAVDALPAPRAKVNVNTAGPYALLALVPSVSLAEAESIARSERAYEDPAQFVSAYPEFGPAIDALAVASDYFDVRVRVDCDGATVHLQSLVYRDPGRGGTRVLRRNFGRIWFNTDGRGDDGTRNQGERTGSNAR